MISCVPSVASPSTCRRELAATTWIDRLMVREGSCCLRRSVCTDGVQGVWLHGDWSRHRRHLTSTVIDLLRSRVPHDHLLSARVDAGPKATSVE